MVPARFDGTVLGLDEPMLAYRQAGSAMERGGGQAIPACMYKYTQQNKRLIR